MDDAPDNTLKVVRTAVIVILLLVSLIGNSLVVFASAISSNRKMSAFNAYLISMASFGLLECSLTMSFVTGFSIEGAWVFGDFLMGFNACFTQLQNIGVLLTITAMTADRYFVVCRQMSHKQESSIHRANYTVLYTWIHAFVISLPLLFHNESLGLNVRAFVERCLCGLTEETTTAYSVILIVTSYGIPIFIIIACFIAVFWKTKKEKRLLRDSNPSNYGNYCVQESEVVTQARFAKYVLLLFFLYLIFKFPYLVVDVRTQFDNETSINATNSDTTYSGDKFYYQTAFVWMMFCFSAMFPLVTFAWFAEHKKKVGIYLCCGNRQALLNNSNSRKTKKELPKSRGYVVNGKVTAYRANKTLNNSDRNRGNSQSKTAVSCTTNSDSTRDDISSNNAMERKRIPVLYATADGLHLLEPNTVTKDENISSSSDQGDAAGPSPSSSDAETLQPNSITEENANVETIRQDNSTAKAKNSKTWLTLNPGDLLKRLKKSNSSILENKTTPPCLPDVPTTVVDKRVDVLGSREGFQSEEEDYFQYASSYNEDETDSELNESWNSRTLILPDLNIVPVPVRKKRGRALAISPMPPQKTRSGFFETNVEISVPSIAKTEKSKSQSVVEIFQRCHIPILPNTPTTSIETLEIDEDRITSYSGAKLINVVSNFDRAGSVETPVIDDDISVLHLFDARDEIKPIRKSSCDDSISRTSMSSHNQIRQTSVSEQVISSQNSFLISQKYK